MLKRTGILLSALVLGLALVVPQASADEWNKKTLITVNEPMQIPTLTLQPGKYVLKLADSFSNRHIVQVFNEDQSQILATILAIPNERLEPTGDTILQLWETPKGAPKALRAWFYPGDNFGQEFAYPKAEATALTTEVHQTVPALSDEDEAALAARSGKSSGTEVAASQPETTTAAAPAPTPEQPAAQDDSSREMARTQSTDNTAAQPAPQADQTPASTETTPSATEGHATSSDMSATAELPRTATYFPLLGLTGLLAVGAAIALRAGFNR